MQYSLSQLMHLLKSSFDEIFGEFEFWCVAEVIKCKSTGKATFLELVEYSTTGEIIAKCSASIFGNKVIDNFCSTTKLEIEEIVGQKILYRGKFGNKDDRIYINIQEISSSYTLGNLKQSQSNIIDVLTKEEIVYKNKNTTIGLPIYHIAIISSSESEGLQDFYSSLDEAKVPYVPYLYKASVHGNIAKESVYHALKNIYTDIGGGKEISLVYIIRGGGDMSGILRQNDIDIARGVCHMPVPVIIAVGHTNDRSVLEQIAFGYANTPTAGAHYLIDQYTLFTIEIRDLFHDINTTIVSKMKDYIYQITSLYENISTKISHTIENLHTKITSLYILITKYHPQHILERGYAILRYEDSIKDHIPLIGSIVEIETQHNYITTTVESVATKD